MTESEVREQIAQANFKRQFARCSSIEQQMVLEAVRPVMRAEEVRATEARVREEERTACAALAFEHKFSYAEDDYSDGHNDACTKIAEAIAARSGEQPQPASGTQRTESQPGAGGPAPVKEKS